MRSSTIVIIVVVIVAILAAAGGFVFVNRAPTAQSQNLNTSPEQPGSSPGGGRIVPEFSSSPE